MRKFKFTLDPILKLRKSREDALKRELGLIVTEMGKLKEKIEKLNNNMKEGYHSQETLTQESELQASLLRFYPLYFQGIKADLDKTNRALADTEKKYQIKLAELAKAMGEVKVIDGLKDKKELEWKKEKEKKINEDLEELFLTTQFFKKINQGEKV